FVTLFGDEAGAGGRANGPSDGRSSSGWTGQRLRDVCCGAGFEIEHLAGRPDDGGTAGFELLLRRRFTLPDTVGEGMGLLVCGLNPSIYSAEVGVGFARPGNRFWPAALEAGLVSRDRDPRHALVHHGIGTTDLVKRPTRRADELSSDEYTEGLHRVERLVEWLRPAVVCFVGLAGWRAAVDRKAGAGPQPDRIGGAAVYLMPSTSGLNASSRLADLTDHLEAAAELGR
ncbi:MAG: mismatch-specific DNA-glycosylase, partial [Acidimicrobiales bacterium]